MAATRLSLLLLLLLLLRDAVASGDEDDEDEDEGHDAAAPQVSIVCFDFETVQVAWNLSGPADANLTFFYRFNQDPRERPCAHYTLDGGRTSGCLCLLRAGDRILHFSIRNGTQPLLTRSQWVADYLKPRAPRDVAFLWHGDGGGVTVTCPDLPYPGLLYEVQHRDVWDTQWQSQEEKTCRVTVEGLDPQKCYRFRARVKTRDSHYGPGASPSDWTRVTHWQGARNTDSCAEPPGRAPSPFPRLILICSVVTLVAVVLLLLSAWKLHRVKNFLMPSVPDPKFIFPGLFEYHQGNFQEWITDTQNLVALKRPEAGVAGEAECGLEQPLVVQPRAGTEAAWPPPSESGEPEEEAGVSRAPRGGDVVSLGDLTFVMSDNSYMML